MYKGFFEDMEYVMGLFFKPFEDCCEKADDEDEDEEERCGMSCDEVPCSREKDMEEDDGKACDCIPCRKNEDADNEPEKSQEEGPGSGGGLLSGGPLQDIMKCMFDASDIDYDYED